MVKTMSVTIIYYCYPALILRSYGASGIAGVSIATNITSLWDFALAGFTLLPIFSPYGTISRYQKVVIMMVETAAIRQWGIDRAGVTGR
jgi:hypothetical protein